MKVAVDSSFLVSCYALDAHSRAAAVLYAAHSGQILVSPLNIVEVSTALRARVFRRLATEQEGREAIIEFEADLAGGALRQVQMPDSVWVRARQLSLSHTVRIGARSLDILHVAAALSLGVSSFLTFDHTQALLARAEGLLTPIELL